MPAQRESWFDPAGDPTDNIVRGYAQEAARRGWDTSPAALDVIRRKAQMEQSLTAAATPPVYASPAAAVAANLDTCSTWSHEDFIWHSRGLPKRGRDLPVFLDGLADNLPDTAMPGVVFFAWRAGLPELTVNHERWRELFGRAGYTENGEPAEKPTGGNVILYRGTTAQFRQYWSWTPDLTFAAWHAARTRGRIWRAIVPRTNILASCMQQGDREYVVDTAGAVIQPFRETGRPTKRGRKR
jgi:hypothetical protein